VEKEKERRSSQKDCHVCATLVVKKIHVCIYYYYARGVVVTEVLEQQVLHIPAPRVTRVCAREHAHVVTAVIGKHVSLTQLPLVLLTFSFVLPSPSSLPRRSIAEGRALVIHCERAN
jgi:hypothetical protein